MTDYFYGFPQSCHGNAGIVPQLGPLESKVELFLNAFMRTKMLDTNHR
jgi:hypothetical protein